MRPRLAWNSQPSCLGLLGTGITLPLAVWAAFERSAQTASTLESRTSKTQRWLLPVSDNSHLEPLDSNEDKTIPCIS